MPVSSFFAASSKERFHWMKGREYMDHFVLHSEYKPTGDQPEAIKSLVNGLLEGKKTQVLLGATGTGKTFTIANVIKISARVNPFLFILHLINLIKTKKLALIKSQFFVGFS